MKTVATANKRSNPDVKGAIILFETGAKEPREGTVSHLQATYYSCGCHLARTLEEWIKFQRGLSVVLKGQNVTQGPASYVVRKTLLKGDALTVFEQSEITCGSQTVPHFNKCLDDVAEHVFLEKAGQIQKCYMQKNLWFTKDLTVKEWVA
eukprot:1745307-Ditylum_brightwellii.AAC.1